MALSPAARHRQRVLAQKASAAAPAGLIAAQRPESGPEATEYQLLLAELGADLARLKSIQSVEGKITLKAELIGNYRDHVLATLDASAQSGTALQDEIVATMMIWAFDIGEFDAALRIAQHVLHFGLSLPQNIKRQAPTLVAEEVAEAALKAVQIGEAFDLRYVIAADAITAHCDMPDQVRAKLFKARGKLLLREAEVAKDNPATASAGAEQAAYSGALAAFRRALSLDKSCGVKKDIEQLERKVQPAPTE